jgi:hypothetical protein
MAQYSTEKAYLGLSRHKRYMDFTGLYKVLRSAASHKLLCWNTSA